VDIVLNIVKYIIAYIGIPAGVLFLLLKFWGKKWLETYFQKDLESHRYQLNTLFNRINKVHEKEFDVLPEMFSYMIDALDALKAATSAVKEYPNIMEMPDERLREILIEKDVPEYKIGHILSLSMKERQKDYQQIINFKKIYESKNKIIDFHKFVERNLLFLSDDLQEQFSKADGLMWSIAINYEVGEEATRDGEREGWKMKQEAFKKTQKDIQPIIEQIRKLVQKRLRFKEA
jgi:hypothetical protein